MKTESQQNGDTAPLRVLDTRRLFQPSPPPRIPWIVCLPLPSRATLAIAAGLLGPGDGVLLAQPVADAQFQTLTDFEGLEQAAALSRDGHFAAFLSDRDGQMDVWVNASRLR